MNFLADCALTGHTLVELVLPQRCAVCRGHCSESSVPLCCPCLRSLGHPAGMVARNPALPGLPPPWAVAPYEGAVRTAIVTYKERGRLGLARPLGHAMARSVLAAHAAQQAGVRASPAHHGTYGSAGAELLLVPVPARRSSVRRRGYDPLRVLARIAARALRTWGYPARSMTLLTHIRLVADQSQLRAAGRVANMSGALAVPAGRELETQGKPLILVDDVITTGATLAEAGRALRAAGAQTPYAALVAATQSMNDSPRTR